MELVSHSCGGMQEEMRTGLRPLYPLDPLLVSPPKGRPNSKGYTVRENARYSTPGMFISQYDKRD